jgi:acyl carrier protein
MTRIGRTWSEVALPEVVQGAVFRALDDLNELLGENQLVKSRDTVLIGPDAFLDSMAFVNLIAAVEERVEEALGAPVHLTDGVGAHDAAKFRTVGTLSDYILRVLTPVHLGPGGEPQRYR